MAGAIGRRTWLLLRQLSARDHVILQLTSGPKVCPGPGPSMFPLSATTSHTSSFGPPFERPDSFLSCLGDTVNQLGCWCCWCLRLTAFGNSQTTRLQDSGDLHWRFVRVKGCQWESAWNTWGSTGLSGPSHIFVDAGKSRPDGSIIDAEGGLWNAEFGTGRASSRWQECVPVLVTFMGHGKR